ncbi:hypothetical protein ACRUK9_30740, partial [Burkholderia pseudomallei]
AAANARGATKNERCWRAYRGKRRIIDPAVSSGKGASVCHPHDSSMTPDRQLNESVTTCCCQT